MPEYSVNEILIPFLFVNLVPPSYRNSTSVTFPQYEEAEADWDENQQRLGLVGFIADLPRWEREKSFCINLPLPKGQPRSNMEHDFHEVSFCNVRGREESFKLDTHGFCFAKIPPLEINVKDANLLRSRFVPDTEQWLQAKLNADMVHVFDYTASFQLASLCWTRKPKVMTRAYLQIRHVKPPGSSYHADEPRPPSSSAHTGKSLTW